MAEDDAIRLEVSGGFWVAVFEGPHRKKVVRAFGAGSMFTAFGSAVPAEEVWATIQALNPGVKVYLSPALGGQLCRP